MLAFAYAIPGERELAGRPPQPEALLQWLTRVAPFRDPTPMQPLLAQLHAIGFDLGAERPAPQHRPVSGSP